MSLNNRQGIKICGTGKYIPKTVVSNEMFEKILDTSDEWISSRTGIKERCMTSGEPTWYMSVEAAREAVANAGIKADEIDLIINTCVTPDYAFPSMSCIVQNQLGAIGCMTMDINCACSGFVYAVDMARRYLYTGDVNTVLIVSSEMLSNICDFTDRSSCILFGDGAAAAVVQRDDKLFSSHLGADGKGAKTLYYKHKYGKHPFLPSSQIPNYSEVLGDMSKENLQMDGKEVYRFATKAMTDSVIDACKKADISVNELDLIIAHQANIRIIKTAASMLEFPLEKMYNNLDRYGNTSSASIPICLSELYEDKKITSGMKICAVGFGAGLTYGAVIFEI